MKAGAFDEIFAFDNRIRFCALIDEKGDILSSQFRDNTESLEPEEEDKRLFSQLGFAMVVDRGWDKFFGPTKVIVIMKERVNLFLYSLADYKTVVIAADPDFPISSIGRLGETLDTSELPKIEKRRG